MMEPPLTTVAQPGFEMGQEAARLLIRHIEMRKRRCRNRSRNKSLENKIDHSRLILKEIASANVC
jgi:LacI family transcriptional regulator